MSMQTDHKKMKVNQTKTISRRTFIAGIGASAGLAITRGEQWLGHNYSEYSFQELFSVFEQSLSETQREHTFLAGDDPMRQVTLTEAAHKGSPHIGTLYNNHQIGLIRHLYASLLSSQGQKWMQNTINLEGRFEGSVLKIYSDDIGNASTNNSQVVINGGHYMLRSSDLSNSGYALGGPIAYGQQLGNNNYQVQGNAFKVQGDALNQLHKALSASERNLAYKTSPPNELLLQTQGITSSTSGVRIGQVSDAAKEVAQEMMDTLFAGFTETQKSEAWSAIDENGGIDSLSVTMYTDFGFYPDGATYSDLSQEQRRSRGIPYVQVWRIEGPAFTMHFKGHPHVHAYMNIVRDPQKIAIGEVLTSTEKPLDQSATNRLIDTVLKHQTSELITFFPEMLLGRISPGAVSTGSIYTLDPFGNNIVVADIRTEAMSSQLKQNLIKQGRTPQKNQTYKVATVDYMLRRKDIFGASEDASKGFGTLRDALIQFVRDKDLSAYYG